MKKSIKLNADYETVLFEGRMAPPAINHSIEFLAFYLEEGPFHTTKKYHEDFLNHVKNLTGHSPETVSSGAFENWWGELKNPQLEKKLNSKEMSAELSLESQLVSSIEELKLVPNIQYLAKSPFGMSGQNFKIFSTNELTSIQELIKKTGKLVVEPLFERVKDFSHYVFSKNEMICYENLVDSKFQYKGTVFRDLENPTIENLSFYHDVDSGEWDKFKESLKMIIENYEREGAAGKYSIDSFTYKEDGMIKVRALSEVNYRKTMGLIAWKLSKRFSQGNNWSMFVLGKGSQDYSFKYIQEKIQLISQNCLQLSPGDSRFEMFLLMAKDESEGKAIYQSLSELLPGCQFSVKL